MRLQRPDREKAYENMGRVGVLYLLMGLGFSAVAAVFGPQAIVVALLVLIVVLGAVEWKVLQGRRSRNEHGP